MKKNPTIKIDLNNFRKQIVELGVDSKIAVRAFIRIAKAGIPSRRFTASGSSSERSRVRQPSLKSILNPNSRHYDDTPDMTRQLSLIWFNHQRGKNRFGHNRIMNDNRQWVTLVQIKRILERYATEMNSDIATLAVKLFNESEGLARKMGKKSAFLNSILYNIDELMDSLIRQSTSTVTPRQKKIFKAYTRRRIKITKRPYSTKLLPGSPQHVFVEEIDKIMRDNHVSIKQFFDIQFEAFKAFDTFPRISNLVTDKAIDRLQQGMVKMEPDELDSDSDKEYWDEVRKKLSRKNKNRKKR